MEGKQLLTLKEEFFSEQFFFMSNVVEFALAQKSSIERKMLNHESSSK